MSNIESILTETRVFEVNDDIKNSFAINAEQLAAMRAKAEQDHIGFWSDLAREKLVWSKPFTIGLDESRAPHYEWFSDGELNVSYNCIDRHLEDKADKVAIIFEGDQGDVEKYTYKELHDQVCRFANTLTAQGVKKGDRVIIYMPMIPQAVIAMQACARIGAIHSVVFGGFSAEALSDRIKDAGAKMVITTNGSRRGGKTIPLKGAVDTALEKGCDLVKKVIVYRRTDDEVPMQAGRDIDWLEAEAGMSNYHDPVAVSAEHPLFLLYTSGSTGKPKGVQHSSGGYLLNAHVTNEWMFDLQDKDIFWCTADVGWITGHSYVAYGPLSVGATMVMFEGVPTYPDAGRFWQVCQDHAVTVFYTAPTAIRALMKFGADLPKQYNLDALRLLGTVGEPINPEAWIWYHEVIGQSRCPIIDTWWQTETGAHMIAPFPITPLKPGSCTQPLPGIAAVILDEAGNELHGDEGGLLAIKKPWPSMIRTIWNDDARYKSTYFPIEGKNYYVVGDSAHRDADGYFWILGRVDDVLNVSGHRLGTMEIESALVSHPRVAEAAVVGRPHDVKGEAVAAFVVLNVDLPDGDERDALVQELRNWVSKEIGPIAKPDDIRFGTNLPKTRSGKIMRRLLRTIAKGEEITQDTSTLEDPSILEQFQKK
ncbi:acetyl-coenzyme A synthetase [Thiosulfatimonas sediminis]|uniref:Acetyl-coenzyme A synthetase n=1 Tax=Thiosulfatimonas sediminis TaxID=2675054 RepID=A0A6F8PV86_9GAMM|nr:acetate--CoA ligase [Thiosulfatimonas sediminis]BBP46035.1 acetyl-coenzyme A synthetase [Thiosulfatimonas sediminis]